MSKTVEYVRADTSIKDVSHLIFVAGINGVPVCKNKKVIGFITEKDILAKFLPTLQEHIEDPIGTRDFQEMEKKVTEILTLKAKDIMSKKPTTVREDTPLLRAQSLMFAKEIGRLPVVDKKNNLIGMLSKGDIFRSVVGDKLPFSFSEEEYHDWISKYFDKMIDWKKRLDQEIPDLAALFKKEKSKKILDIGFGTAEHDIALAHKGFQTTGIESSALMHKVAKEKVEKLPISLQKRIKLFCGDYTEILKNSEEKYQAAIFLGNAFAHLAQDYENVLAAVIKSLDPKNAIIIMQVSNFYKIYNINKRFWLLSFAKSDFCQETAFFRFYDPQENNQKILTQNTVLLDNSNNKWRCRSVNRTPIANLSKEKITEILKKYGFKKISFYGGETFGPLFKKPFNITEDDWLNIVGKR